MKKTLVIWIWLCAWLNCAGWFLSAVHELNAGGYAAALAVGIAAFFIGRKYLLPQDSPFSRGAFCLRKRLRRFKRPFPLAFAILSAMAFIGGALYAPSNYDGLAYRLPRVLHWLAANQWHWIHTIFPRLNDRACGIEWVSAPFIAILRTDRLLFLINIISFLFLPGLIFSVLTRLGIRRRVAWHWMWIAPTGYCFLLQAGSIGNDAFSAPFALAAVDFALRSKTSKSFPDFFASILAAALMTGAKTSNLPLLLPWAIAILPSLRFFLLRPFAIAVVCVIAVFASFLPTAALNAHFCGDWSGMSLEADQPHGSIVFRTAANTALITIINLTPPIFPEADKWNRFVQKSLPPNLKLQLRKTMTEPEAADLRVSEMQIEEDAGQGFGVTALLLTSIIVAAVRAGRSFFQVRFDSLHAAWRAGIVLAPWISLFALLSQSEVIAIGRILAPYYPLLLPLLLASPQHERLVKQNWWRVCAWIVFVMAAGLLIISPARPLFPVQTLLEKIQSRHAGSKLLTRIETVYSVYRDRSDAFAPAIVVLPPGLKILGAITSDDPETSLWQPFGSRRIIHVCPADSADYLKGRGIEYVLAKGDMFGKQFPAREDWLKKMNAQVIQTIQLDIRASTGATAWYLVKLN